MTKSINLSLTLLVVGSLLSGCSNLGLNGLSSTAAATTGAVIGTAVLNPVAGVTMGVAAGVATDAVIPEPEAELAELDPEVAKTKLFWDFVEEFVMWIVGGFVALTIAAWIIPGPQTFLRRKKDAIQK